MLVLFLTVFIDLVGFGIVIPLLPFYGEHFHAAPYVVTWLMATYSLFQFVAAPLWGAASDRFGRKPVLIVTLIGAALSYVMLGEAQSLIMLFAARVFGGLMAGNIGTAFAYVADVTTPENRAKGMGMIGAAFGLGFIAGPALGGVLAGSDPATANYALPAYVAAGLSATAVVVALFALKESLSHDIRARIKARGRVSLVAAFGQALRRPTVGRVILLTFLATLVFAGMEATFAMWAERQFTWGPRQIGYLFAYVGILGVLVQGGMIGRLAKRFGESSLVIQGTAGLGIGLALIPVSKTLGMLLVAMGVLGIGFALCNPSLASLLSKSIDEEERGAIMGVSRSATTLARVVGPAVAGILFSGLGRNWPFYAGALVMAAVVVLSFGLPRHRAAEAAPEA